MKIPRKNITKFFASKVYPLNPAYFRRIVNFAIFNEYFKPKKSSGFRVIQTISDGSIPKSDAEEKEEFDFIKKIIGSDKPITYLEFGVYQGRSIRSAAKIFSHHNSKFIGFDTFEGLPEKWTNLPKGHFDVDGKIPYVNDARIFFIKGLFQTSLHSFITSILTNDNLTNSNKYGIDIKNSTLIINMDADLYSSTLYCLTKLDPIIKSGTIIRFDEFFTLEDECMAFRDYVRAYYKNFEILAANDDGSHTIIRIK